MIELVKLPIGARPKLVHYGLSEHGFRGMETYELPSLWCLHLYFYHVNLEVNERSYAIVPGSVTLIPPGHRMIYQYGNKRHRHFYVHFGMNRRAPVVRVPLFQHLPEARDELFDRLQNVRRIFPKNSLHAETLFWALLWDIVEAGSTHIARDETGIPKAVQAVDEFIESQLPKKMTVSNIADHLGFTPSHVNRLVKTFHGVTTVQLIRKRRLQRVCRFLLHSTMPIRLIAAECGIADLQQFNKLVRREYGKGPRQLRDERLEGGSDIWATHRE